jgi:prepilin-type N-terminal cleavage/methylation domain-containing protein
MKQVSKSFLQKGFTLIELLVVVAIIGILSTVVLASLTSARSKARDTAIKSDIAEFEKLLVLEFDATGSYYALQPNSWVAFPATCDTAFTGTYATKATEICRNILSHSADWYGSNRVFFGTSANTGQTYSVMATISTGVFFCAGSTGKSSVEAGVSFTSPGCWANP